MIGWVGKRPVCAAINQRSRPADVSGERFCISLRRQPPELRVRTLLVVIASPRLQHGASVRQRAEQRLVQQLVTQPPVEAFVEAVLLGLARRDVTADSAHVRSCAKVVRDYGQDASARAASLCAMISDWPAVRYCALSVVIEAIHGVGGLF